MEITRQRLDDTFELKAKGRLDAYWAGHLSDEVAEVLRGGARSIRLNMKEVEYVSSAGIRVLFQTYKQLKEIQGTFAVSEPSEAVRSVLELAGVAELLFEKAPSSVQVAVSTQAETFVRGNAHFEILETHPGKMTARVIGSPELLVGCQFHKEHCQELLFGQEALGIGLGAFGKNFEDCKSRFGEFLAAAGVAVYLPTDGSNVADYVLSTGDFVPRLQVLYGLTCEGDFSKIVYFESRDNSLQLTLREIVEACREMAGSDAIAVAMIAESAGLMGAALRRSPALEAAPQPAFEHPQIRQWLSFTAERAYARSLALVVGVATSNQSSRLNPIVRPLAKDCHLAGHFHAASFSYHPLKKGETNLMEAARGLFEVENLQGVLHLLNDERESGAGQSEFFRGACWIGSIAEISAEK